MPQRSWKQHRYNKRDGAKAKRKVRIAYAETKAFYIKVLRAETMDVYSRDFSKQNSKRNLQRLSPCGRVEHKFMVFEKSGSNIDYI